MDTPDKPDPVQTPEKDVGGRPKAMDDAMKSEVVAFIREGGSITQASGLVGVGVATLDREKESDKSFRKALARATALCQQEHIRGMRGAKNTDWRMHLQFLSRKFKDDWAERVQTGTTVNVAPVPVIETVVSSREEAARFRDMTQPHNN
jgi:hypothetical protein